MKTSVTFAGLLAAGMLLGGCARLAIYSDAALKSEETGIKFYIAKPYLLVARTGNKDKPTDVSVIYLPDMSKPLYAKPIAGYGSAKLSMTYTNGMVTAFGQETDSKIPESLTALGGLAKSIADARKTNREALGLVEPQAAIDYSKYAQPLGAIAADIRKLVTKEAVDKAFLSGVEAQSLTSFAPLIENAANQLADPTKAEGRVPGVIVTLKGVLDAWKKQVLEPTTGSGQLVRQALLGDRNQLEGILGAITPKAAEEATFTLYEIDNSGTGTTLKEVKL